MPGPQPEAVPSQGGGWRRLCGGPGHCARRGGGAEGGGPFRGRRTGRGAVSCRSELGPDPEGDRVLPDTLAA